MPRGMPKKKVLINNLVNLYFVLNDLDNKIFKRDVDLDGKRLSNNEEKLLNCIEENWSEDKINEEGMVETINKLDDYIENINFPLLIDMLNNILEMKEEQDKYLEMINEKLIPNLEFVKYIGEKKQIDEE